MRDDIAYSLQTGVPSSRHTRIYTGILGQFGDIVTFTPTVRRLKQLFPESSVTFAVSSQYREAGELIRGLPYVDQLFVTEHYFEQLTPALRNQWENGQTVDLRGEDEVEEQKHYDLVLETRPRPKRMPWWEFGHLVSERAHMVGVPGPIDLQTEIRVPGDTKIPQEAVHKIVLHNDPAISAEKAWPWSNALEFVEMVGPGNVALLGNPGPEVPGALDLRGQTTLAQAAGVIAHAKCYVGIDSSLLWIAASLQVPAVGLFGTSYVPAREAGHPCNPRGVIVQVEGSLAGISAEVVGETVGQLSGN